MYRRRWIVVAAWLAVLCVSAVFAPRVLGVLRGGGYTVGNSQSVAAYNVLNHAYGYRALTFTVVFTATPRTRSNLLPSAIRFQRMAAARFGKTLHITAPVQAGPVVFERIYSAPLSDFGASYAAPLRSLFPGNGITARITGSAAIFHDMEVVSDQDLRSVEIVILPIALAVLLLIFGSVTASVVPVLMAPIS